MNRWLRRKISIAQHLNAFPRRQNHHLIELRQVVKTYRTPAGDATVLQNIDLQVTPAEFVAILGKSGSGKTTLLNMIAGIDRPTQGEVIVDGMSIHLANEDQMAIWRGRNLGIVFQFFQLLPTLTVVENVVLPMEFCRLFSSHERFERALALLDLVDLADQADKLPVTLSGGQQQRAAIARALANDPKLLLADEPTGNIDTKTSEAIFNLFEKLVQQGKTIVIVTHDMDIADRVPRLINLTDGEIREQPSGC